MSLFEKLLEIETGKKNQVIKAVYIKNSVLGGKGTYYLYYYDMVNNTFYINDLDFIGVTDRTSTINIIEHIVTRAYKLEMNSFIDIIKKIQITKNPDIHYFYRQKQTRLIIMDRVTLVPIRDRVGAIRGFKSPSWDSTNTQKYSDNDKLLCEL